MRASGFHILLASIAGALHGGEPFDLPVNTWVKLSPLEGKPPSPRLGYEGACVWDTKHRVMIRYGGHNQGGGGEQNSEIWSFEPLTARWRLHEPNTSPPGICCGQQNVFDPVAGRYIRFPAFSGSHGWQWWREIYLNDSSVWTYDLESNTWRNLRPLAAAMPRPLRCASWDSDHEVVVLFAGEGSHAGTQVYDPYTNTWTAMKPERQPSFRSGGNAAYDSANKLHVLFGSQFSDDPHTWVYDLRRNEWRDRKPPAMPPTDRNDAVMTYDPTARVVLAIVKVSEGEGEQTKTHLETWAYDAAANSWRRMRPEREPHPSGNRARQLMFAPAIDAAILENRTHPPAGPPEQQVLVYRHGARQLDPAPLPAPPAGLRLAVSATGITLHWEATPTLGADRYLVRRGEGEHPWEAEFAEVASVPAGRRSYTDEEIEPQTIYYYEVRAAVDGRSSTPARARAQPRIVQDVVVSALSARRVKIAWKPSGNDAVRYFVERAVVEVFTEDQLVRLKSRTPSLKEPSVGAIRRIGPFRPVAEVPVKDRELIDTGVDLEVPGTVDGRAVHEPRFHSDQRDDAGKPYRHAVYGYRVRAVNVLGVMGGPSPMVLTIPSAPQHFFAREDGDSCRLRWAANPEEGIAGYRVYRMDGRYDKSPIPRLTAEPLTATEFTDPMAGTATRRYHVVAVDALGQEGFPSSPVWHRREWRKYYTPFTGEWHQ